MNMKVPKAGEPITESFLRDLATLVSQRILGGEGIRVEKSKGGMVIHNTQVGAYGGGVPKYQPYTGD